MANTDKEIVATVTASTALQRTSNKYISVTANVAATFKRATGKKVNASATASASINRGIGKKITANTTAAANIKKATGKHISKSVTVAATKEVNAASLTLIYVGNAELGLGAEEGSKFDIIVSGTFTTFSITINGKTLTYTESCTAQTITIDNVNATCKNGITNKMSKLTGDTTEFLKLLSGANVVTYAKIGSNVDFQFDFRPQYI